MECPYCEKKVDEDEATCPHCGNEVFVCVACKVVMEADGMITWSSCDNCGEVVCCDCDCGTDGVLCPECAAPER